MRKNPGTTAVIVLALGIGVNTSAYLNLRAMVLHPLPFPDINRVLTVWETVPKVHSEKDAVAPANFLDWKQQSRSFEVMAAFYGWDANLTGIGEPERLQAYQVSPEFFTVLGMKPVLGRTFRADQSEPGHSFNIVISNGFWQRRFASAPDALGRHAQINGQTYTIAGVMPKNFDFPLGTDVWAPLAMTPAQKNDRVTRNLAVIGRLKAGAPVSQARVELETLARRIEKLYPDTNEGRTVLVKPVLENINPVTDRFVSMLMATASFVLLLACANVANLQLARAMSRQKEMAVRTALGAGRMRIVCQLIIENVVIALVAGGLGLVLAQWNLNHMMSTVPPIVRKWVSGFANMQIDGPVVLFTLAASVGTGILCAVPSFLPITRRRPVSDINEALKESARSASAGPRHNRMRNTLATAEVALALVLMVSAGLMVRTFQHMLKVDCGYDPNSLLTLHIALPETTYRTPMQRTAFYDRLEHNLRATAGVRMAGAGAYQGDADAVYIEGRAEPRPNEPHPGIHAVVGNYIEALGVPILLGRAIGDQDRRETQPVVVLSESIARYYFPKGDALGQHIRLHKSDAKWLTVAGVVGDIRNWFDSQPYRRVYTSFAQMPSPAVEILLRTQGDPDAMSGAMRAAVRDVDANQPLFDMKSMQQVINEATSGVRASAVSMTVYALIALVLAVTGIYASVSYSVAQRTREIGVRMALGADKSDVLRMTLTQAVAIAGFGLGIGVPVALVLMKLMSSVLYNVVVIEPLVFVLLTAILTASAMLAGYVPARRAASIDPLGALREE